MGPSVSFPLPLRIAQKLPARNSWGLINKKLPIPFPICYFFELIREVLANTGYLFFRIRQSGVRGPPQFLKKKRSENAWASENISCGFPSIPGNGSGVASRIVGFVLLKSWDAIPRMEFRIPRMEF